MDMKSTRQGKATSAALSALLATSMIAPFAAGCGNNGTQSAGSNAQPPTYGSVPAPGRAPQPNQGMSTGKKVAILAGTAALLYLYNRHKNAQGTGAQGKYYRSKNGRIYYRDAQGNAVYVTPPAGGIQVPADEAARYNRAAQAGDWEFSGGDYDSQAPSAAGSYGGSGYGAPYGGDRTGAGSYGGGSAVPPGPRTGGY